MLFRCSRGGGGGEIEDMDNYHPISILPVVSKLLERVVLDQLSCFLQEMKLLTPFQCGFRKGHSTESAVISFTDTIRRNMDQGCLTGTTFIDLRKAFDTVDYELLLERLRGFGLEGV